MKEMTDGGQSETATLMVKAHVAACEFKGGGLHAGRGVGKKKGGDLV